ncbi:MAG: low affinity iron permease family protein [Chthoniobacterales bacterium]|nr:low affinity iron permease family protein [Chthoniobacterales bacterium]
MATKPKKAHNSAPREDDRDLLCKVQDAFRVFARRTSEVLGTAWSFVVAIAIIAIWAATGHIFHYSDTWQLIINTGTTIVTFLMVFLIQNTQNRDSKAVNLKLDELIRAVGGARNNLVDLERMSDQELVKLQKEFQRIGNKANEAKADVAGVKKELKSR